MRVIAGSAGGIALVAPRGPETRPITDRVKETLFGILGARVLDARAVDLFAGSGAIGIEALSRGASEVTFVERSRPALEALRRNLERTRLADRASVAAVDVRRWLATAEPGWDLAFLDPPYAERAMFAPLERLAAILAPGGMIVVKHFWRADPVLPTGLVVTRRRRFGETALTFLEPMEAVQAP